MPSEEGCGMVRRSWLAQLFIAVLLLTPVAFAQCKITDAYWSAKSAVDGDTVSMTVITNDGCNGYDAIFRIYEDDPWPAKDDYVTDKKTRVSGAEAKASWKVKYTDDLWGDPEFYFTVEVNGRSKSSSNMKVYKSKNSDKGTSCSNECSKGERKCFDGGYKKCKKNSNGCWVWGEKKSCGSGKTCSGGSCVVACSNECSKGERKCFDGGYKKCKKNSNGCWVWGEKKSCGSGKKCNGGYCVQACSDQCSEKQQICEGNGYRVCSKNSNGCLSWSSVTYCSSNEQCSNGKCQRICHHECVAGEKRCSGNGYQKCETDSYGCFRWSGVSSCKGGEWCENGTCKGSPCEISNAYWSAADSWLAVTARENDTVTLMALTNGKCNGEKVVFKIREADSASPDAEIAIISAGVSDSRALAKATWTAKWQPDCILGLCDDPEYYFEVYVNGSKKYSPTPLLWVTKSFGAEAIYENGSLLLSGENMAEVAASAAFFNLQMPPKIMKNGISIRYLPKRIGQAGERFLEIRIDAPHTFNYEDEMAKYVRGEISRKPSRIAQMYHINIEGRLVKILTIGAKKGIHVPLKAVGTASSVFTTLILDTPTQSEAFCDKGEDCSAELYEPMKAVVIDSSGKEMNATFLCGGPKLGIGDMSDIECKIDVQGVGVCYCTHPIEGVIGVLANDTLTLSNCTITKCELSALASKTISDDLNVQNETKKEADKTFSILPYRCTDECGRGERKCDGEGYKICEQDSEGCWRWGSATHCAANEICQDGACILHVSCPQVQCNEGEKSSTEILSMPV